jgi:hypothetical protein
MRLFYEFAWEATRERFDRPVTRALLDELYGGILYHHITQNSHDTYVSLEAGAEFGRVSLRSSIEGEIQHMLSLDAAFIVPLMGLTLHLGGYSCDATSYSPMEEIRFSIITRFEQKFYSIPVECHLNKGIYETVQLHFYRASRELPGDSQFPLISETGIR